MPPMTDDLTSTGPTDPRIIQAVMSELHAANEGLMQRIIVLVQDLARREIRIADLEAAAAAVAAQKP